MIGRRRTLLLHSLGHFLYNSLSRSIPLRKGPFKEVICLHGNPMEIFNTSTVQTLDLGCFFIKMAVLWKGKPCFRPRFNIFLTNCFKYLSKLQGIYSKGYSIQVECSNRVLKTEARQRCAQVVQKGYYKDLYCP